MSVLENMMTEKETEISEFIREKGVIKIIVQTCLGDIAASKCKLFYVSANN